jgi:hypothetical protein
VKSVRVHDVTDDSERQTGVVRRSLITLLAVLVASRAEAATFL